MLDDSDVGFHVPKMPKLSDDAFSQSLRAVADDAPSNAKSLSTRSVRTWREKVSPEGNLVWLRRSWFVAREFAWLQPDRDALLSPASSSIVACLLLAMLLVMREYDDADLAAIDVKDAFLTVPQETPTVVRCQLANGNCMDYNLGKVPGWERSMASCHYWSAEVRAPNE
eukprot:s581_g20.t3